MKEKRDVLALLASAIIEAHYDMTETTFLPDEAGFLRDAAANGEMPFVHAIRIILGRRAEETLLEAAVSAQNLSQWIVCNEYALHQSETDAWCSYVNQIEQLRICKRIASITRRHFPGIYLQCLNIAEKTVLYTREGQQKYSEYRNYKCAL